MATACIGVRFQTYHARGVVPSLGLDGRIEFIVTSGDFSFPPKENKRHPLLNYLDVSCALSLTLLHYLHAPMTIIFCVFPLSPLSCLLNVNIVNKPEHAALKKHKKIKQCYGFDSVIKSFTRSHCLPCHDVTTF